MEITKCTNCGADIYPGQYACTTCGTPVAAKRFCTNCGAELGAGQSFCSSCGTPAPAPTAAPVPTPVAAPSPAPAEEPVTLLADESAAAPSAFPYSAPDDAPAAAPDAVPFSAPAGTPNAIPAVTPISVKRTCDKCGAELAPGQGFCTTCGNKVNFPFHSPVSLPVNQYNAGVGEKKKKKTLIIVLAIAIPVVVIAIVAALIAILSIDNFPGRYNYVGGDSDSYYTFDEDNTYFHKVSDETEHGTYEFIDDEIFLTDSDGDDTTMLRDGKYIFTDKAHFDETIQEGSTISQTLTKSVSTTYKGSTVKIASEVAFHADGTYEYKMEMTLTYLGSTSTVGDTVERSGTYERKGNYIIMSPKGQIDHNVYVVRDGIVYDNVFEKAD